NPPLQNRHSPYILKSQNDGPSRRHACHSERGIRQLLTPIFAIIICLWGTLHTRDVEALQSHPGLRMGREQYYKHAEPDRPEFVGTMERPDPITGKSDSYYPGHYQAMKFVTSFIILLLMSDYDNALILKLFAFEFANSYSSLFYIAFFRDVRRL
uniref:Anoctamin n=1 Tax=Macrostomum lignano TaxID=282301 RepID=A0A1I8FF95_9PLAT